MLGTVATAQDQCVRQQTFLVFCLATFAKLYCNATGLWLEFTKRVLIEELKIYLLLLL